MKDDAPRELVSLGGEDAPWRRMLLDPGTDRGGDDDCVEGGCSAAFGRGGDDALLRTMLPRVGTPGGGEDVTGKSPV